jgi:hypothetical protein
VVLWGITLLTSRRPGGIRLDPEKLDRDRDG